MYIRISSELSDAMDIEIVNIHEQGSPSSEYAELKVLKRCDLEYYILADATYTAGGKTSNKLRHMFWFPKKIVDAGDYIYLYTGQEGRGIHREKAGHAIHYFYWGLDKCVWNNDGDNAVLFYLKSWSNKVA